MEGCTCRRDGLNEQRPSGCKKHSQKTEQNRRWSDSSSPRNCIVDIKCCHDNGEQAASPQGHVEQNHTHGNHCCNNGHESNIPGPVTGNKPPAKEKFLTQGFPCCCHPSISPCDCNA